MSDGESGFTVRDPERAREEFRNLPRGQATGNPFALGGGYRVDDLARRLAEAVPGTKTRQYFARQIRGWAQRGLLESPELRGHGPTAARVFDADALYRARLLSFLTSIGMKPEQMQPIVDALTSYPDGDAPLLRVRRGENVYLVVMLDDLGQYRVVDAPSEPTVIGEAFAPAALVIGLRELFGKLVDAERREAEVAKTMARAAHDDGSDLPDD